MRRSAMAAGVAAALAGIPVETDYIPFVGGLDQVTPPLQRKSGMARLSQNFEVSINGGYRRIAGYERFDGRTSPSDGIYSIINVTISGSFAAGNTITGVTSAATAVVLAVVTSSSPNYLVVTKVSGTFVSGETLNVAAAPQGVTSSLAIANGASTGLLHAQYNNLAADNYRADIAAVPGSGSILGVVEYNDVRYAFRNAVGGLTAALYKSTTGGWSAVSLGEEISFSNANTSVGDGDTLTQGGVTATIGRVVVQTGTLASGVNTGRLIISGRGGGNYGAGAATSTGGGNLTLSAIQTAITLSPSGRYEFIRKNFGGSANTTRVYGCDGVNRAFEFDGTVFVPIATGMTSDAPAHITEHKKHLFLSFVGSIQHSGTGTPYMWTLVTGAGELAMGDTVTGFGQAPGSEQGSALPIFTRNRCSILYGSSSTDWNLVGYREEVGAFAYTIQDVGYSMFLDDRGITNLQTSMNYGNFQHAAISNLVKSLVNQYRPLAVASCISRDLSQYRLFFTNNYAFYITVVGSKIIGIMPVLFPDTVRCTWSGERLDGSEAIYFGSDDGWVYQMEKGTSFDGDEIEYYLDLAYNFQKRPRVNKCYRDCTLEVEGSGYASFNFGFSLGYGSTDIPQPDVQSVVTNFSATFWDAFVWDAFYWDGVTLMPNTVDMNNGEAENVSLAIRGTSDYYQPFTLTGAIVHFTPRKRLRP